MTEDDDNVGGTAVGMNAYTDRTGDGTAESLSRVMTEVAEWIEETSGSFLGHVKMAITAGKETVTLNLTGLDRGVEHHGTIPSGVRADIKFMAAVLDVDHDQLGKRMETSLISNGFKIKRKGLIEIG